MRKILALMILLFTLITINPVYALGEIVGPDIVIKENNEIVSISDIISLYTSSGGTIFASVDEYTNRGHLIGDHRVVLSSTDGLIEKTKEITVRVTNNKIPDVEIDDVTSNVFKLVGVSSNLYYFMTYQDKTVTTELIGETLVNLNLITIIPPMQRQILADTYTEAKTSPGTYILNFRILDASGSIKSINTSIKVVEVSGEWDDYNPGTGDSWWDFDMNVVWTTVGSIIGLIVVIVIGYFVIHYINKMKKKFKNGGH